MKALIFIIICALQSPLTHLKGQEGENDLPVILENLYRKILDSNDDAERLRLNDSVKLLIEDYVTSDSVFSHKFTNLKYLGQIESPDSRVKIINWNLILRNGDNKYFCYIIRRIKKSNNNIVCKLAGEHREENISTSILYNPQNWYGALYYTIQPFKRGNKVKYLLLGIDAGNSDMARKIIDVMIFDDDNRIVFGEECFIKDEETNHRVVFEYSAESIMTLRRHNKKSVIFDHLEVSSRNRYDTGEYFSSGYIYDAYVFKKGFWRFTSNIDIRNRK